MDKRKVELIFGIDLDSYDADRQELERRHQDTLQKMQSGINVGTSMSGVFPPTPSPTASHDTLQGALGTPGDNVPWQELINAVRTLTEITSQSAETSRKANETAQRNLAWQQANALLNLGNQTVNQVAQGNFFGAAGGAIGGLLGLPFWPGGMAAGASIGGMAGNFLQGLSTGAGGARAYTADASDLARRFGGIDQLSALQDYGLGSEQGYKAEETLSQMGRLQASRIAGSAGEAAELVPSIQQLTRALGLNAEATIDLYQGYVQTGGDRGGAEFRDYMAQVVGGAISAGFESNIQMYGELLNSARTQSVTQSGSLMSDRAFGQLQGVLANLTGTDARASRFFRENPQFAQAGMNTYLSMGGAGDPYSTQAGYLRLAGVAEHQIDRRFTNQETQMANAGLAMDFLGDQMMQYSGMSRAQFQAAASADPNFVRSQMAGNVNLQRLMGTQLLPGLIGRDATAQDMRAFEQLSNIAIANGGQLPTGTADGSGKVAELLGQLNMSPADQARQAEADRHNKQMEVMANFQNLMTKTDEWMANIYGWISESLDLAAIEETILSVMNRFGTFVSETAIPFITDQAIPFVEQGLETAKALAQWAKDNNIADKLGSVARAAGARSYEEFTSGNTGVGFDGKFDGPLSNVVRGVAARFNDTPGDGVTAKPGYNTFQFAEGDQVFAFQGGGNTLGDLLQALENLLGLGTDYTELTKELHDEKQTLATEQFDVLALSGEYHAQITEYQAEQTEKIFPLMEAHLGAIADAASLMPSVDQSLRDLIGVTVDIATMVNTLQNVGGGVAGGAGGGMGGGGAFASGLFTGPSANIGGSSAYHIDTKFNRSLSWEQIAGYFDQMAAAYAADDRRIEFSNAAVSGEVYDHQAGMEDKIALLRRAAAAHSHSPHANWHSFDYYIPQGNDSRHGSSAEGAEMMLPSIAGGRVEYGQAGNYGSFANIMDSDGNVLIKTGHGDNRRALPSSRTFTASAGGTFNPNVPPEFQAKVNEMAGRLGMNPDYLMAVMGFETGGTFDPSIRNAAGSGATGLIQFMPSTARGLGTSTGALAGMSQLDQLDYVEQYLSPYAGQLNSLEDTYMSVLYPAAIGRGAGHTLFNQGTTAYRQNSGLDINEDGRITVGEATNKVREYLPAGGESGQATRARNNIAYAPSFTYTPSARPASGNIALNITVNVSGASGNARQEAYEGTVAAVDEFEREWRAGTDRSQPDSSDDYSYS